MYVPEHINENDAEKLAAVASRLETTGSESDSALARLMKGK